MRAEIARRLSFSWSMRAGMFACSRLVLMFLLHNRWDVSLGSWYFAFLPSFDLWESKWSKAKGCHRSICEIFSYSFISTFEAGGFCIFASMQAKISFHPSRFHKHTHKHKHWRNIAHIIIFTNFQDILIKKQSRYTDAVIKTSNFSFVLVIIELLSFGLLKWHIQREHFDFKNT